MNNKQLEPLTIQPEIMAPKSKRASWGTFNPPQHNFPRLGKSSVPQQNYTLEKRNLHASETMMLALGMSWRMC
jgi:hypothetical protein